MERRSTPPKKPISVVPVIHEVHPKNELNSLSGKEWIILTKSVWFQNGLGKGHVETKIETQHPAPFSYKDVQKLILMFTKPGMLVLDPFCGVGSTLKAAALSNRNAIGIEISSRWTALSKKRIKNEVPKKVRDHLSLKVVKGDCVVRLAKIDKESIDFIVTSPPYWSILNKDPDHKIINERIRKGLATRYSTSPGDLGNITDYRKFLRKLSLVAKQSYRVLRPKKYLALIVGDFRHGSKFYPYHQHAEEVFESQGFLLRGITILAQNNKRLFPYGYPFSFVQNVHHQYVLIFQKPAKKT
jgi:DNA modification methylase